jgi:hypothetical protein
MQLVNRKSEIVNGEWLPDMDLNHDKQIQSLLCYRYTIGQAGALDRLNASREESRFVESLNRCTVQSSGLQLAAHHPVQRFSGSTV